MDDVDGVQSPDNLRQLRCDLEELVDAQRLGPGPPRQVRVACVVHDEREAAFGGSELVNLDDAGHVHRAEDRVLVAQRRYGIGVPRRGPDLLHDEPSPSPVTSRELMPGPAVDELELREHLHEL